VNLIHKFPLPSVLHVSCVEYEENEEDLSLSSVIRGSMFPQSFFHMSTGTVITEEVISLGEKNLFFLLLLFPPHFFPSFFRDLAVTLYRVDLRISSFQITK